MDCGVLGDATILAGSIEIDVDEIGTCREIDVTNLVGESNIWRILVDIDIGVALNYPVVRDKIVVSREIEVAVGAVDVESIAQMMTGAGSSCTVTLIARTYSQSPSVVLTTSSYLPELAVVRELR